MPSTRDKYVRVEEHEEDQSAKPDHEIRLTLKRREGVYLNRAYHLFFDEKKDLVLIKAAENAIPRAIKVAEVLKKRIPGLHQVYKIVGNVVTVKFKPTEIGLDEVRLERVISVLEIKLTKTPTA
jgi:DNA-binding protein